LAGLKKSHVSLGSPAGIHRDDGKKAFLPTFSQAWVGAGGREAAGNAGECAQVLRKLPARIELEGGGDLRALSGEGWRGEGVPREVPR